MQKEQTTKTIMDDFQLTLKLGWLESLAKVGDYDFKLDYIQYESGYYTYDISFQDFEIGDTIETINNTANIYSCCGDILDKDYMRCPTCQEHC